jgi:hypothetical protein
MMRADRQAVGARIVPDRQIRLPTNAMQRIDARFFRLGYTESIEAVA